MSKESDDYLYYQLKRNLADGVHTFGRCPTVGCSNYGRGSGLCKECCVKGLKESENSRVSGYNWDEFVSKLDESARAISSANDVIYG